MEWLPIESAPRDCEALLLLMGGEYVSVGRWDTQEFFKKAVPHWKSERGTTFGKNWDRETQPTHWMPLPPPPTA